MARRFDRLGWAMDQPGTTPTQRFVLLVLADMANEQGECWPKHATLAERTGYGLTAVRQALRDLRDQRLIDYRDRVDKNKRQTSNMYTLDLGVRVSAGDTLEDVEGVGSGQGEVPPADTSIVNHPEATTQEYRRTSSSRRRRDKEPEAGDSVDAIHKALGTARGTRSDEPEAEKPTRSRRSPKPNSAPGLAKYWADEILVKRQRVSGRREDIMRRPFKEWLDRGVEPDVIREMVQVFLADRSLSEQPLLWKTFLANAEMLLDKALRSKKAPHSERSRSKSGLRTLPEDLRAEFLAEAEDVA